MLVKKSVVEKWVRSPKASVYEGWLVHMWVKYVVPKKRETETIFGVRPIFKSHLNCYDSMISRDTSSTVKLRNFTDWKK